MPKRSSTDLNQTAFNIVQQSTGQAALVPAKNPAAVALGRLGGLKGGNSDSRRSKLKTDDVNQKMVAVRKDRFVTISSAVPSYFHHEKERANPFKD